MARTNKLSGRTGVAPSLSALAVAKVPDDAAKKPRKRRKWRHGRRARAEIIRAQRNTKEFWLSHAPVDRIVREIVAETASQTGMRVQRAAIDKLRGAADWFLTDVLGAATMITTGKNRQTLSISDLRIALALKFPEIKTSDISQSRGH
jgi:histone H3/H4